METSFQQPFRSICIAFDDYPMLSIVASGTTKTELLESVSLTSLYNYYLPYVYAYGIPYAEFQNGKLEIDGTLQLDAKPTATDGGVSITKVELVTVKNKQEIARTDVTDKVKADYKHVPVQATYDAKYGDEFCIYIVAEDSLRYTHKVLAYYWHEVGENTSEALTPVDDSEEIYDKNGNLLTGGNE